MRKFLLVCIFGIPSFVLNAQTTKGRFFAGGSIADFVFYTDLQGTQLSIQPSFGYFFAENLVLGLKPQVGINTINYPNTYTFVIQPLIRKYFGKSHVRFFVEPTAGLFIDYFPYVMYVNSLGQLYQLNSYYSFNFFVGNTCGFTYFMNEHIGLDFGLSYNHVFNGHNAEYIKSKIPTDILGLYFGCKAFF